MIEQMADLHAEIRRVAGDALQSYVRGLVSAEWLVKQIALEWELRREGNDEPAQRLLRRITLRICSFELYNACRSCEPGMRNLAFENLSRYLQTCMLRTPYARVLQQHHHALEDVLHRTLEAVHVALNGQKASGPSDAAAFLKWCQTILIRHAHRCVETLREEASIMSLEAQMEAFGEEESYCDRGQKGPEDIAIQQELQQALTDAVRSLRNQRYQAVLLYTYLGGWDESEVARKLEVSVQEIYMWRHRALKQLRKQPAVLLLFQSWLE
jgi:RNA polymerase sigma factor (sigma-70 family)